MGPSAQSGDLNPGASRSQNLWNLLLGKSKRTTDWTWFAKALAQNPHLSRIAACRVSFFLQLACVTSYRHPTSTFRSKRPSSLSQFARCRSQASQRCSCSMASSVEMMPRAGRRGFPIRVRSRKRRRIQRRIAVRRRRMGTDEGDAWRRVVHRRDS